MPQPVTAGLLAANLGSIVTALLSHDSDDAWTGAPSSRMKWAQSQNGPGSQCIPATPAAFTAGTLSWPRMWARSSGTPNRAAR